MKAPRDLVAKIVGLVLLTLVVLVGLAIRFIDVKIEMPSDNVAERSAR